MAARYRTADGNWSTAAQWDGGTLPTAADDCYCNGFIITLDQDVTALSIRNDSLASPVIAAGGLVNITTLPIGGRTITANLVCDSTTSLLQLTATANTLNIIGNGTRGNTGNGGNVLLLSSCAGTTVNLTGNWQSGTGGGSSQAIGVSIAAGNLYHTGVLTGTTAAVCLHFASSGARTVSLGTCAGNSVNINSGTGAGHTVTISNIDVTVAGFSNHYCASLGGIIASATLNTSGDIPTGTCLAYNIIPSAGSGSITVNVNGGNGDIYWPATPGTVIIYGASAGVNCTINCRDIYSFRVGSPNSNGIIYQNSAAANTLTINARDVFGGTVAAAHAAGVVNNSASATVVLNLSGTNGAVGGGPGAIYWHHGATNASTGTFYLYGIARGGTASVNNSYCAGFFNASTGTAFVTKAVSNDYPNGSLPVGQFGTIQYNNNGFITLDSSEDGSGGWPAASGRHFVRAGSTGQVKMRESNAGVIRTFGSNPTDYPIPANVRDGISYNSGASTGTLKVPPTGSVAVGVPVDATVGTAVLNGVTLSQIEASTVLAMKSDVTGVPAAVRSNLSTELARIDTNISSRLPSASYVAPDNSSIAAIKSKTDNLPASPASETTVLARPTLTQIETSTVLGMKSQIDALPAAIRSNLNTELSRIDASVSSRLATASYVAPDNSSIAAIKSKTDNLPLLSQIEASTVLAMKSQIDALPSGIRTNLAAELSRIDVPISSRLASGDYTPVDLSILNTISKQTALIPALV